MLVETNNFLRVLEQFDSSGNLNDKDSHLHIECPICLTNTLAIVNPDHEHPVSARYEQYTVLPRCGHAFGHICLNFWLDEQGNAPKCPACRLPIFCEYGHRQELRAYGNLGNNTSQAEEIVHIRALISQREHCERCQQLWRPAERRDAYQSRRGRALESDPSTPLTTEGGNDTTPNPPDWVTVSRAVLGEMRDRQNALDAQRPYLGNVLDDSAEEWLATTEAILRELRHRQHNFGSQHDHLQDIMEQSPEERLAASQAALGELRAYRTGYNRRHRRPTPFPERRMATAGPSQEQVSHTHRRLRDLRAASRAAVRDIEGWLTPWRRLRRRITNERR
ncbi:hypothetical protein NUW58_g924 [Xylaria curta]|uniref:Uncharacterized protein n=1 Tax=Xylaria curta TaxID=42375 RepID=A0ACC1PQD2_9PEZI|nr:hypothetical protein NUW58_g924 [Xylaria curta]